MFRLSRHIPTRFVAALLTLTMLTFPALGSGMLACSASHGNADVPAEVSAHSCCSSHESDPGHEGSDHSQVPSRCAKCLHACCRAADVADVQTRLVLERVLMSPMLLLTETVRDSLNCDAIFHPPRA